MEYITKAKLEELSSELEQLKTVRRKEIAEALEYAKSLGDLSENAEYHQSREDQALTEDRIKELESIIKNAVVAESEVHSDVIVIGSSFTLVRTSDKKEFKMTIVGQEEIDTVNGKISFESPIGKAVMGAKAKAVVKVQTPKGDVEYTVKNIA